jgi:hypothetical protein
VNWDATELEQSDACINLAGRSVNCRYTATNRREITESRLESTHLLGRMIASSKNPPAVWMNASTATIYRHSLDHDMDESGELGGDDPGAPSTWNFSIRVANAWEAAFFGCETPRTRKVALRSAMTFSPDRGGVFHELLRLVRFGMGGAQGPGTQYVSWIHEYDFIRAVEFLISREDMTGVVNVSSPRPLCNREFMRALRQAWGTSIGPPIPKPLIEMGAFLLRTESELILKSRRVVPDRLQAAGFEFEFPEWLAAARELVARWRAT